MLWINPCSFILLSNYGSVVSTYFNISMEYSQINTICFYKDASQIKIYPAPYSNTLPNIPYYVTYNIFTWMSKQAYIMIKMVLE